MYPTIPTSKRQTTTNPLRESVKRGKLRKLAITPSKLFQRGIVRICYSLQDAHSPGLVKLAISPSNILNLLINATSVLPRSPERLKDYTRVAPMLRLKRGAMPLTKMTEEVILAVTDSQEGG